MTKTHTHFALKLAKNFQNVVSKSSQIDRNPSLDPNVSFLVLQGSKVRATRMPNDAIWEPELTPSASEITVNCKTRDIATKTFECGHERSSTNCNRDIWKKTCKKQQAKAKGPAAWAKLSDTEEVIGYLIHGLDNLKINYSNRNLQTSNAISWPKFALNFPRLL